MAYLYVMILSEKGSDEWRQMSTEERREKLKQLADCLPTQKEFWLGCTVVEPGSAGKHPERRVVAAFKFPSENDVSRFEGRLEGLKWLENAFKQERYQGQYLDNFEDVVDRLTKAGPAEVKQEGLMTRFKRLEEQIARLAQAQEAQSASPGEVGAKQSAEANPYEQRIKELERRVRELSQSPPQSGSTGSKK